VLGGSLIAMLIMLELCLNRWVLTLRVIWLGVALYYLFRPE
jgi:hypothetical protein